MIYQVLFLKSYSFLNYERIIKHAFLGQSGIIYWAHIVIYA